MYMHVHTEPHVSFSSIGGIDFIGSRVVGQFDALSRDLDKCFNVNVLGDSLVEGEESFTVSLHLLTNLSPSLADRITINQNQMKVNIIDTSMYKTKLIPLIIGSSIVLLATCIT